jgi:hypothetical protein
MTKKSLPTHLPFPVYPPVRATKKRPVGPIVPYYPGALAPTKNKHDHAMRAISYSADEKVLLGCARCGHVEVQYRR